MEKKKHLDKTCEASLVVNGPLAFDNLLSVFVLVSLTITDVRVRKRTSQLFEAYIIHFCDLLLMVTSYVTFLT